MSFYQRLQNETQAERQYLLEVPLIRDALAGKLPLESYTAFLTQAYHHVKHTVPLFMAAGSRLGDQHEWVRQAMAEYITEEIGHQEWILNDLAACGVDQEAVRNSAPAIPTELMLAYAYDTIQRKNPLSLFGMVQVLEGTSISVATPAAEKLQSSLNLPGKAFSYLLSHGSLDQDHIVFFENLVNRFDDRATQNDIIHSAKVFYALYGDIFRSVHTGVNEIPQPRENAA
jgi:pyrroloquinoline quinone (PQQ) biosynthesis protein C